MPKVLMVEDEEAVLFAYGRFLGRAGYETLAVSTLAEAREALAEAAYAVVLLDMYLPDGQGMDLIEEIKASSPDTAIIIITGAGDVPLAVDAMRRGADNFLTKPVDMAELEIFMRKSIEVGSLRRCEMTRQRLSRAPEVFFGDSASAGEMKEMALLAAGSDSPVLITGETGTGKGVLARWIHEQSGRKNQTFVEVNCSSLRGDLLSSELFGHAKGAFTSAVRDRAGLIDAADGGTLFLDEIGDMDIAVQSQFLKVVEEKSYRRLGEVKLRTSDFRLVAATNHDLEEDCERGQFRRDLHFRINVLPVALAALKDRAADIPGFAMHLLNALGSGNMTIPPETLELLVDYTWPGNVRELKNVLERALILSRGGGLKPSHFIGLNSRKQKPLAAADDGETNLERIEETHIRSVIDKMDGDMQRAAKALGVSRSTLYRKIKKPED